MQIVVQILGEVGKYAKTELYMMLHFILSSRVTCTVLFPATIHRLVHLQNYLSYFEQENLNIHLNQLGILRCQYIQTLEH